MPGRELEGLCKLLGNEEVLDSGDSTFGGYETAGGDKLIYPEVESPSVSPNTNPSNNSEVQRTVCAVLVTRNDALESQCV